MGYGQWIQLKLHNKTDIPLTMKNLYVHWGRLYDYPNKNNDVPLDKVENHVIAPGATFSLASCGKENSWPGTEGDFNLYVGGEPVMKIYWNCPHSGSNDFNVFYVNEQYDPVTSPWTKEGPLGPVTVTISKNY